VVLKLILETCVIDQRNQLRRTDLGVVRDSLQEIKKTLKAKKTKYAVIFMIYYFNYRWFEHQI
jgi:hypothetical protein